MEQELLPSSLSNTRLERSRQKYTATVNAKLAEEEIYTTKSWFNVGKGQDEITFFFFF